MTDGLIRSQSREGNDQNESKTLLKTNKKKLFDLM